MLSTVYLHCESRILELIGLKRDRFLKTAQNVSGSKFDGTMGHDVQKI